MSATSVTFRPIGVLRTPHRRPEAMPIQPVYADDCLGRAEVRPEPYAPRYDAVENPRGGWTEDVAEPTAQQRGRRRPAPAEKPPSHDSRTKAPN